MLFNFIHSTTRIAIEHAFGLLKQRFRQLFFCKLRSIDLLLHFIRACVVLHNICVEQNDELVIVTDNGPEEEPEVGVRDSRPGIVKRNEICESLFLNRRVRR